MLTKKKTKVSKMRGTSSHGWGHKKKHRGKGHRGGVGLSGTGARGDAQKSGLLSKGTKFLQKVSATKGVKLKTFKKMLSKQTYFGKRGFASIHKEKTNVLALSYIENNFEKMVESGLISKEGNDYVFDSKKAGYNKILGGGILTKKLKVICDEISQTAEKKITDVGGSVVKNISTKEE